MSIGMSLAIMPSFPISIDILHIIGMPIMPIIGMGIIIGMPMPIPIMGFIGIPIIGPFIIGMGPFIIGIPIIGPMFIIIGFIIGIPIIELFAIGVAIAVIMVCASYEPSAIAQHIGRRARLIPLLVRRSVSSSGESFRRGGVSAAIADAGSR